MDNCSGTLTPACAASRMALMAIKSVVKSAVISLPLMNLSISASEITLSRFSKSSSGQILTPALCMAN